jgi:hypothetical protein
MTKQYMRAYFQKYMKHSIKQNYKDCDDFVNKELATLLEQVWACSLLNNFFWGVWALALLKPESCTTKGIFNYDFAHFRC